MCYDASNLPEIWRFSKQSSGKSSQTYAFCISTKLSNLLIHAYLSSYQNDFLITEYYHTIPVSAFTQVVPILICAHMFIHTFLWREGGKIEKYRHEVEEGEEEEERRRGRRIGTGKEGKGHGRGGTNKETAIDTSTEGHIKLQYFLLKNTTSVQTEGNDGRIESSHYP